MLEGASIVSFAVDQWTDVPRCRHHVMSRLAERNRVLFTSSPWYVRDALRRGRAGRPALTRISDNLHTYTPPRWLPYTYRFPRVDGVMRKLRALAIEHVLDRLAMARPILYIWHPSFADVIGQFDARAVVYHCYDEYAAFGGSDRSRVAEDEARILAAADVVVTVSEGLYSRKRALNANTHLVRNGVDYALFASAQSPSLETAVEVRDLPRPVIGCVTRIVPEYFDAELLHEVFSRRPEWSFVVVGPECATSSPGPGLSALKKLPNVHLLGRRGLTELPSYLKAFDACLIPYVLTENKQLADPLKVYEYLAAGKPVVSKPLTALAPFGDLVSVASTADEWIEAIEHAIHDHSPERVAQRQAIARQNTWDDRVERIARLIAAASMG
ncbi:MAG TPA: glycosyltransferase [Vicinamibacterales bacterium]|jgi:glycosyltransferase involved in cell wall biosynthesis|nr:glycosyltransferase [Vicinamibacterales bacterium]